MPTIPKALFPLLPTTLALALAGTAAAQSLSLDQRGGAVGGLVQLNLQGLPDEPYLMLFDLQERQTPIPGLGITLAVTDAFASVSFALPGFFGQTSSTGAASAALTLPNDPALESLVISLQAIAGQPTLRVSNLTRLTPQRAGTFSPPRNQPPVAIAGGTVVARDNGEVLFCGGSGPLAQVYQSRLEEWTAGGTTFGVGLLSQATALQDGRILFTGGLDASTGQPTAAAAVYDPIARTTTTLAMAQARAGHGASALGNGKVLISGGLSGFTLQNPLSLFTGILGSTEVFDPATNSFAAGPNLVEPRALHSSTTLTSGQVLIAGGLTLIPIANVPTVSSTAYRFNPATNSFGLPAVFSGARFLHSAVALSNGKVLLCGGLSLDLTTFLTTGNVQDLAIGTRNDCQVYAPSLLGFGTFTTVNGMQEGRAGAAVAPLPNGGALIAGGFRLVINPATLQLEVTATATADVLLAGQNAIAPTGPMAAPRLLATTVRLPDGTIMVVGGGPVGAEIYQQ